MKKQVMILSVLFCLLPVGCSFKKEKESTVLNKRTINNHTDSLTIYKKTELTIDLRIIEDLYTTIDNKQGNYDSYESYDLDRSRYDYLIDSFYRNNDSLSLFKEKLKRNHKKFIDRTRTAVTSYYNQYYSVEGEKFSFLISRKDSLVPILLKRILEDRKMQNAEKDRILLTLKKEFIEALPDSLRY